MHIMIKFLKELICKTAHACGYRISKIQRPSPTKDMDEAFVPLYERCKEYTMTSPERMYALYKAVNYIADAAIPGDIVECGVWRGGSCMLGAFALKKRNDFFRSIYLYDTFTGMAEPGEKDRKVGGAHGAHSEWQKAESDDHNEWCYASLESVKRALESTGYPAEKLHFIQGKVENTIPETVPESIALLRLDTDWYESTKHEMEHLFPRLKKGGVLIIDDYGHWAGAREAVDEYLKENNITILLNRVDYTGRIGIKV